MRHAKSGPHVTRSETLLQYHSPFAIYYNSIERALKLKGAGGLVNPPAPFTTTYALFNHTLLIGYPMQIKPSPEECTDEALSPAHLAQAVKALQTDGYVVIEDIVSHDHLDLIRERMDADAQLLYDAKQWSGAGGLPGHLMLGAPPFAPFVFRDIVANPFAVQVSQAMLGDRFFNGLYSGNSNCPGSQTQPLHRDVDHLWSSLTVAHPAAQPRRQHRTARHLGRKRQYRALARLSFRSNIWLGYQRRGRSGAPRHVTPHTRQYA